MKQRKRKREDIEGNEKRGTKSEDERGRLKRRRDEGKKGERKRATGSDGEISKD